MATTAIQFRRLRDDEFTEAYAILVAATQWLLSKNLRQWTVPFPREAYRAWHDEGANYGLVRDGNLAVVVSLKQATPPYWTAHVSRDDLWWLSKLAVAPPFRGQGLGRIAVQQAKRSLSECSVPDVYTDVVYGGGFLPAYYESLGFQTLARTDMEFATGIFDMVLMRCELIRACQAQGELPTTPV